MRKKLILMILAVLAIAGLTACYIFLVYNSREEVESYAKQVVGEDITFVSEEKNKETRRNTYTFQDISIVSFAFSTSDDTRWTEEGLYEYLKKQYDEDVKQ